MADNGSQEWLTRPEVAEWLRTPVVTLGAWAYKGRGPKFILVGRKALYRRDDVQGWLDQQPTRGGA